MLMGMLTPLLIPNPTPSETFGVLMITQVLSYLLSSLIAAVSYAFQSGVLALIYVDLRIRKEGFDLLLLKDLENATEVNPDGIPGAPLPAAAWAPQ